MKRVLVVHFSQTGQLSSIIERISGPLRDADDIQLDTLTLRPATPHPFPWPFVHFFDTFPETVNLEPGPLEFGDFDPSTRYDLIVLGVTIWFLSPSQPVTAFLQSAEGRAVWKDTPVVTVIACRNMWHNAYDTLRRLLDAAGARHRDNIVLTDPSGALASLVTTPRWMLSGRRDAFWFFPAAGIPEHAIDKTRRFGRALLDALRRDQERQDAPMLSGLGAATAEPRLLISERAAFRGFRLWGRLLRALGRPGSGARRLGVRAYIVYMFILVTTLVPLSLLLQALLRPLLRARLARQKALYELPSGSSTERNLLYDR